MAHISPQLYLLYDYLLVAGGAERLSITIARAVPGCTLVVARLHAAAKMLGQIPALLQLGGRFTRFFPPVIEAMIVFALKGFVVRRARTVIYSGFYAPFAVFFQQSGRRIYYCHTPPRVAFDLRQQRLRKTPALLRPFAALLIAVYRHVYQAALRRMDIVIANSATVQHRLQQWLGINARIIYPPVETGLFNWQSDEGVFVSTARLETLKRVDLIIDAFRQLPHHRLVVMSGGREADRLRAGAEGCANITFTGYLPDKEMRDIIGKARAVLYMATDEDFGMSPVEAMAAGKPVIGVAGGGLLETVVDGETGLLLAPDATAEDVRAAVESMTEFRATGMRQACEKRAAQFNTRIFLNQIKALVDS